MKYIRMNPAVFTIFVLYMICTPGGLSHGQDTAAKDTEEVYEWPMKACDAGWTGYSPDPRVKPPFRLKWATQAGIAQRSSVSVGGGRVFSRNCCLNAETGEVLWKKYIGGNTPAFYKGRIYTGKSSVKAYDAATGEFLWTSERGYASYSGARGGLPITEGRIYGGGMRDHNGVKFYFACTLDAETGKEIWSTPLVPVKPRPDKKPHELGPGMGEMAVGGRLAVAVTYSPAMVFGLDQKTGRELWRQAGMCALVAPTTDGKSVWVTESTQGMWALEGKTGKKLWHWGRVWKSKGKKSALTLAHYARVGTARHPPAAAYGMLFASNDGRYYTAIDAGTGKEIWIAGDKYGHTWAGSCGPPVAAGGYLYTSGTVGRDFQGRHYRYILSAVDHKTGKPVWKSVLSGKSCAQSPLKILC